MCAECPAAWHGVTASSTPTTQCRVEGCTECATSADSCTACNGGGFRLAANGTCERCASAGCISCDASPQRCDYCSQEDGTGPDPATGSCVKCLDSNW